MIFQFLSDFFGAFFTGNETSSDDNSSGAAMWGT